MGIGTNSHIKPLLELGKILRERNHDVCFAGFDSARKFNKPYRFPFLSLGNSSDVVWDQRQRMKEQFGKRQMVDPLQEIPRSFGKLAAKAYDATYPALADVLEDEMPDVVLCDFFSAACRDVAEMRGIPLITGFQSTDILDITSAPFLTINMVYGSVTTQELTFLQRFHRKVVMPIQQHYRYIPLIKSMNLARAKHNVPPSNYPFGDFSTSLGLASSFVGFEAAIPFPPNIKIIGPIRSDSHDPLTPDIDFFLETHPRTLYIAFGSAVILAEFDIENLVLGSFNALESGHIDGILWGLGKTIQEDFPKEFNVSGTIIPRSQLFSNQHPHARLLPWAPQTAILEHKHTRLFISHGGLESSFEAILSGTPILCMPFLGDQPRNARKLEDAGVGKYINRITAAPEDVTKDIKDLMEDATGSLSANVRRMRTIAITGSRRKEDGAAIIEEYVSLARACRPIHPHKYGQVPCEFKHLSTASRNMSVIQASLIDVYAFAILLIIAIFSLLSYVAWILTSDLFEHPQESINKEE
ncbi:hypothetical protein DSO57_1025757 [Entomophthora muscae]|uniref:Uncharacterized protein n=1 Tax=Entomophthora muscae TaxID=34485 RepID=A0ACC2S465_9FUNG|nr:hypothetical protein DSO57_1025757 [Entomophthora muscae]